MQQKFIGIPRFDEKVELDPKTGCWEWQACRCSGGYGNFRHKGRVVVAHRLAYETLVGPIPEGLDIDHLCRNRKCVNPHHLEPVTRRENILRGEGQGAKHARKTHCQHGHPLSGENLYINPASGQRVCRECLRGFTRAYHARKKALAV